MNNQHSHAINYLGLMAKESGKPTLALTYVALLNDVHELAVNQFELSGSGN